MSDRNRITHVTRPNPDLIGLADETYELGLKQFELLLFLADEIPDPPSRIVTGNYNALQDWGLVETYIRRRVGGGSLACRPTVRGRAVSELAVVEDLSLHPR